MERSTSKKLLIVLLTALLGVFLIGISADAHFPGKACENETPLAKNKHCAEGHGGENPGECSDGKDNDGDGLVDGDDPDCEPGPEPETPECSDGIDNDRDGKVDFGEDGDPDCESPDDDSEAGPRPRPACSDGEDNDGDGLVDGDDPGCEGPRDNDETDPDGTPACSDGEDNDGDGLVDGDDPGCEGPEDNDETDPDGTPACSDGEDNDGDGLVDGDDPGCESPDDDDETDPDGATTCGDPDGDGVDHSAFDPDSNEGGLASSIVHEVDQALPSPLGGDQGVVTEINCALVVTVEEIVGING